MRKHLASFAVLALMLIPNLAFAAVDGTGAAGIGSGAGFAIGLAAMGCGIGQGLAAFAALQGIARNPSAAGKIQTPMIIGLALIESLCIYALVIAFFLQGKI